MPRIFISYRRSDSISMTGRIYDRLVAAFGDNSVFKDVDDIPIGADFRKVLEHEVGTCDILLVVIGRNWLNVSDEKGRRRLDDPDDFVRIEVESGLKRDEIIVVPVLVSGAAMPPAVQLPDGLKPLAYHNAAVARDDPDFNRDMTRLIDQLKRLSSVPVPEQTLSPQTTAPLAQAAGAKTRRWLSLIGVTVVVVALIGVILSGALKGGTGDQPRLTTTASVPAASETENTQATTPAATLTASPLPAEGTPGIPAGFDLYRANTVMSFINIRSAPDVTSSDLGDLTDGEQVAYNPSSLNSDGWAEVQVNDVSGWVDTHFVTFENLTASALTGTPTCPVADGYDSPVGTTEERRTTQIWPGQWLNASPFDQLLFVGTPSEAYNTGVDLNLPSDADAHAPVYAAASGVVTFADQFPVWGNVVVIKHDPLLTCNGQVLYGRYAHVENMLVSAGEHVDRGQQIASVGNAFGRFAYNLAFDLSPTDVLQTRPDDWPSKDEARLLANYVDPQAFIASHRPSDTGSG